MGMEPSLGWSPRRSAIDDPNCDGHVGDPVRAGFVASLARPGGNMTGFTPFESSAATKWLADLIADMPAHRRCAKSRPRSYSCTHPDRECSIAHR